MEDNEQGKKAFYSHAGRVIKTHRKQANLTGKDFGAVIGVSKGMVSGYENGTAQIPGHTLYKISKVLEFEFAEYDPEIPKASEILRQIIEFKQKREQNGFGSFRTDFTMSPSFHGGSEVSIATVQLREDHRQFFDEYMANANNTKRKAIDLAYELMNQYGYYKEMPKNARSLFERSIDYIFEDKNRDNKAIIIEIREKYQI